MEEEVGDDDDEQHICVWAWKRRGGWAGGVLGTMTGLVKQWEYRSIVVTGHTLSYYEIGTEDSETPRGSIDLWNDQGISLKIGVPDEAEDVPTPHQMIVHATKLQQQGDPLALIDTSERNGNVDVNAVGTSTAPPKVSIVEWKLCFDQQEDMVRLMALINRSLEQGGAFQQKDVNRFEHDLAKGDHIYRWEMIVCPPVIYPIQIHAIVLEAGRNCLVVADFGLTGYAKKKDAHFHHAEDNDEAMQKQILAAFRKLRPTDSTQRLNIVTLTDQREIRKWFKAGYDEESMLAKAKAAGGHHHIPLDRIGQNVGKMFKRTNKPTSPVAEKGKVKGSSETPSPLKESKLFRAEHGAADADECPPFTTLEEMAGSPENTTPEASDHQGDSSSSTGDDEPAHVSEQERAARRAAKQLEKLPHSDPVEIVLARANFCLENMNLLPPYHVFFSNSECIAVWCKTGRWSTLQTAVWCSTNSMGALKTSTLTTIGVAAANPLLAPVIAIGGLLWVSAPMLILHKSREAWEGYTQSMTNLFWSWAPNAVFVSAVENWTTILKLKEENIIALSRARRGSEEAVTCALSAPENPPLQTNVNERDSSYQCSAQLEDEKKVACEDNLT